MQPYCRAITSDPGRFPVLPELNDTWRGSQECEVNVPLAKTLQSEHWDVDSFPAVRHLYHEVAYW